MLYFQSSWWNIRSNHIHDELYQSFDPFSKFVISLGLNQNKYELYSYEATASIELYGPVLLMND